MIVVAGTISIDPEQRDAAIEAARAVMAATREEPGCLSYTFSADLGDPGAFLVFEEWESQEALDAHFRTPHMAAFQQAVGGLGVRGMDIRRYEIARKGPLGG